MSLLRNFDLFVELTKTFPKRLEEAYREARKFINLQRELGLDKRSKVTMEAIPEKEKEE